MNVSNFQKTVEEEAPKELHPLKEGKSGAYVATYASGLKAVVKVPKDTLPNGKSMQRGIHVATHPRREVAFYRLAKLLGFEGLVPETVLTTKAVKGAITSAQVFMPAVHLRDIDPRLKDVHSDGWRDVLVQTCLLVPKRYWRQLLALDIIAGARDRHANNVGLLLRVGGEHPTYRLVAWDNAVTFGTAFEKYHNVFHKFLFRRAVNFKDIWPTLDKVDHGDFVEALHDLLSPKEIDHAYLRLQFMQDYPYRLPWKVMSKGHDSPNEFPDYLAYFEPFVEPAPALILAQQGA